MKRRPALVTIDAMKAIVQDRYGSSDDLVLREVDKPAPAEGEVLVRVHAAAVNARDWHVMRGDPLLARVAMPPTFGLNAPKRRVRGSDVAGRVEAVGAGVTRFRPGDDVYGDVREMDGAFAEYVTVPECQLERKPANLTFEQAAAVPLAGCTALEGLRVGRAGPGRRLLINGASGGVGTFAVQIGKALGAVVTAVCSTRNTDLVRSLGADHVIDYTRADFSRGEPRFDLVFDLVANRSLADLRRALAPGGTLVLSGGGVSRNGRPHLAGPMGLTIKAQAVSRFVRRHRVHPMLDVRPSADNLAELRELIESGKVLPAIDRTFTLAEVPEAIRYLEVEHARAKVVITV